MATTNGSVYRSKLNGELVKWERSVSFEPDHIKITIYGDASLYQEWLNRRHERVVFELTETNLKVELPISNVILVAKYENTVEILVILRESVSF